MQSQALRLRVPYMFLSKGEEKGEDGGRAGDDSDNKSKAYGEFSVVYLFNNFCLEFVATMLLVYSCMYVPHAAVEADHNNLANATASGHATAAFDPLAQWVPAIAIVAMMLCLKDHSYFCPDGSSMTTIVLLAAGAYTRKNDGYILSDNGQIYNTLWYDVIARLLGQILAYIVAHLTIFGPNIHTFDSVPIHELLPRDISIFNETLATFIECVAMGFIIMPLLVPAVSGYKTYAAKVDIAPPKNKKLALAAVSLAVIHYTLERIFRTTMHPFIFYMHCYTMDEEACSDTHLYTVMACQGVGLLAACAYCWSFIPPPQTLKSV
jgi:hypothetical protein